MGFYEKVIEFGMIWNRGSLVTHPKKKTDETEHCFQMARDVLEERRRVSSTPSTPPWSYQVIPNRLQVPNVIG